MEHRRLTSRWRRPIGLVLAVLGGFLGLILLLGVIGRWVDDPAAPRVRLQGQDLQLVNGEGGPADGGISVVRSGANATIVIQGAIRAFEAKDYQGIGWRLDGLSTDQELRIIWATAANTRKPFDRVVSAGERESGFLDLTADPNWDGLVVGVGLAIVGPLSEPLLLQEMMLQPKIPMLREILPKAWRDWMHDEGWSGRSINFTDSASSAVHLTPTLLVAIWCAMAGLLYLLLNPPWRGFRGSAPYVAILLLGWLMLDARWQWLLIQRLDQTRSLYDGLDEVARQKAGPDRDFFPFLHEIRGHLADKVVRLFIVSPDPAGYGPARARYHLLPHNAYLAASLDQGMGVKAGDYVLMLMPLDQVSYERGSSTLSFDGYRLPVSLELARPGLGVLFKVGGGV
ncbi:hypothetical protein [Thiocystis violacea]|uniref:hypothetical protein n=1 Tax=Thiocystis violacea TaxID=13725 RepID=UPI001902E931|nr:hypothetical protein [Thiocystis violacea]MBK1718867.1 hypothetical protein [Thiocystis violacea]